MMKRLPRTVRGAFRFLLRLLPPAEGAHVEPRLIADLERGWRERHEGTGIVAALGFVAREWVDLTWNVLALRSPGPGPGGRGAGRTGEGGRMGGIGFDVRVALRGLRRRPALAVGAVVTLGIGIGANLALFSALHGVLLRALPYGDPDGLVAVYSTWEGSRELGLPWHEIGTLHRESGTMEAVAGALIPGMDTRFVLATPDGPDLVEALRVSPNFFRVLGVGPQVGPGVPAASPLQEIEASVMLSHGAWQRRWGGDPDVVGSTLRITGVGYRVVGILPPDFTFQLGARSPELFVLHAPSEVERNDRGNPIVQPVARLRTGAGVEEARAELSRMSPGLAEARPPDAPELELGVRPLRNHLVGDLSRPLLALGAAALLVLIVACANLAALFLARHTEREADQALRAALGAGRDRLARLPLVEAVLLGLGGGALGVGLAALSTEVVLGRIPDPLFRYDGFQLGPLAALGALGLATVAGLLFGGIPAWRSSRTRPGEVLRRGGSRASGGAVRGTRLLAGAEAGALLVLLVATGLSLRSLGALLEVDVGFEPEGRAVATLILPQGRYEGEAFGELLNRVEARLEALPGIRAAGTVTHLPLDPDNWGGTLTVEGEEAGGGAPTRWELASPGYFRAAGVELLRGRVFSPDEAPTTPMVTVVSRSLARMIRPRGSLDGVLGVRISGTGPEGPWMEVVGVVEDVRQDRVGSEPSPHIYVSHAQMFPFPERELVVAADDGDPLAALREAAAVLEEMEPDLVVTRPRTLDALVRQALGRPRIVTSLLGIFGAASLALALTGIWGVTAFGVARRRREIGIRACLGAGSRRLLARALGESLIPVAAGALMGLGVVAAVAPRTASLLYGVEPLDPATLVAVPVLLLAVAALTAWFPALRATRLDPVEVLREG